MASSRCPHDNQAVRGYCRAAALKSYSRLPGILLWSGFRRVLPDSVNIVATTTTATTYNITYNTMRISIAMMTIINIGTIGSDVSRQQNKR